MADWWIWGITALAVGGVILRPFGIGEVYPAVAGALALVLSGLLPMRAAWLGVAQGGDVYLFLAGMMTLSELARAEGLFAWLAGQTVSRAGGSAARLFTLVYLMGTVTTVFLSNDATAVVLSPAVAAVARRAKLRDPLPYLLICAFTANAASFVLPISNPANLVIYGGALPKLPLWLARFSLASVLSIGATYLVLRWSQRAALRGPAESGGDPAALTPAGRTAGYGIIGTAVIMLLASAFGLPLGAPAAIASAVAAAAVLVPKRQTPWALLRAISWSTLLLVAGLFVLVAALQYSGVVSALAGVIAAAAAVPRAAFWGGGIALAVLCDLVNNLPAGLIAGHGLAAAGAAPDLRGAALIGVDLGPNLSVTGSLATILWLQALRREGVEITAWQFLKLGALIMPPALLLGLLGLVAVN